MQVEELTVLRAKFQLADTDRDGLVAQGPRLPPNQIFASGWSQHIETIGRTGVKKGLSPTDLVPVALPQGQGRLEGARMY